MNNLAICINSHVRNKDAIDNIITSLNTIDIPVLVVIGDSTQNEVRIINNVYYVHVLHNSIDFTGLIYICETESLPLATPRYWLYLHDTCECDITVFEASCNILKSYDGNTSPIAQYPSMNMGIYKHQDIINLKPFILNHKSSDLPCTDEVLELKKKGVSFEDFIFRKLLCENHLSDRQILPPRDVYGNGVMRITEVFSTIGIYKYKANWNLKNKYELGC